ncbi:hypothetical protein [Colwellia sp. MEBiC06753]
MKYLVKLILVCIFTLCMFIPPSQAGVMVPNPDCGFTGGSNCLVFDDFTVFSMSFLQFNETGSLKPVSGDTYYIDSSPGKIDDDIVIASSPASATNNSDISATGIDDAFNTPNAGASDLFAMLAVNEPSPVLTNDNIQGGNALMPNPDSLNIDDDNAGTADFDLSLWDIEIDVLKTFLNGEDMMFFFNLNETGAQDQLDSGQDMLGWLRVYLTDSATGDSIEFTLSGNGTLPFVQSQPQTAAGGSIMPDNILPTPEDEWAYIHGEICVSSIDGSVLGLGSCNVNGNPADGVTVDQNLGANSAAFGLWNEDLNSLIYSGKYDMMSVDLRMAHIENGYEQLFIRAAEVGEPPRDIPEPKTILLLAFSLLVLSKLVANRNHK